MYVKYRNRSLHKVNEDSEYRRILVLRPYLGRAVGRAEVSIKGFTLIELLVVIAIIGIATSLLALQAAPYGEREARTECERLAQLFSVAHDHARTSGHVTRWLYNADRWAFEEQTSDGWRVIEDQALRPRNWAEKPLLIDFGGIEELRFGNEWIESPLNIQLNFSEHICQIIRDQGGAFEVNTRSANAAVNLEYK